MLDCQLCLRLSHTGHAAQTVPTAASAAPRQAAGKLDLGLGEYLLGRLDRTAASDPDGTHTSTAVQFVPVKVDLGLGIVPRQSRRYVNRSALVGAPARAVDRRTGPEVRGAAANTAP